MLFNPPAGLQLYIYAADGLTVADNGKDCPEQIAPEFTLTVGVGFTVIFIVFVLLHPPAETDVTVYVVLGVAGMAVIVETVLEPEILAAGCQL